MIDRVFKNWKTTAIGAVIVIGALATVFVGKATLTEAGVFIGVGISLFFIKDGKGNSPSSAA